MTSARAGLLLAILCLVAPARAEEAVLAIGYLELAEDARYDAAPRPFPGAEVAVAESRAAARSIETRIALQRRSVAEAELLPALEELQEAGSRFVLIDLPADQVARLARAARGRELLLLNVSAEEDALRGAQCAANLAHLGPSTAMLADALAQFLVARKWRDVLALWGPEPADATKLAAFRQAAKRFGVRIGAERPFVLSADPRRRGQGNPLLLTAGADYDAVFVADAEGEFARALPYRTSRPRPVVGDAGLMAVAWHPAWDRYGAPQLAARFARHAGRPMQGRDWAAWAGVKAVVEAAFRTRARDFAALRAYLLGPELTLDGFKGQPLSFRAWDRQLRQPVLLATADQVVERAPLDGFLHQRTTLDTLGADAPESQCRP